MQSFSAHFESLMEKHLKQQLEAQERAAKAQEGVLQTIADALVRLGNTIKPPDSRRESIPASARNSRQNSPERIPERTTVPPRDGQEPSPVEPYRTPRPRQTVHLPGPSASPPLAREMTAFITAIGEMIQPGYDNQRLSNMKLSKFRGKDNNDISAWFRELDRYFLLYNVKDHQKVTIASERLRGGARSYMAYLVRENNEVDPIWQQFREDFLDKYQNMAVRSVLLRQKLRAIKYEGPHKMAEYCEEFRNIEFQIYDMGYIDKIERFTGNLSDKASQAIWGRGSGENGEDGIGISDSTAMGVHSPGIGGTFETGRTSTKQAID